MMSAITRFLGFVFIRPDRVIPIARRNPAIFLLLGIVLLLTAGSALMDWRTGETSGWYLFFAAGSLFFAFSCFVTWIQLRKDVR